MTLPDENPEPYILIGYRKLKEALSSDWGIDTNMSRGEIPEESNLKSNQTPSPLSKSSSDRSKSSITSVPQRAVKRTNVVKSNIDYTRIYKQITRWSIAYIIILLYVFSTPLNDFYSVISANPYPAIADIANNSGLNMHGKALFYRANPELVDANELGSKCPNNNQDSVEFGCYLVKGNKIYILAVSDPNYKDIEYTVAAHETLHAAWQQLDQTTHSELSSNLNSVYKNSTAQDVANLRKTMTAYGSDETTVANELHSFIGSEIQDLSLNSYLSNYYSKYFTNRSIPIGHIDAFNGRLDTETNKLSTESMQLDNSYNSSQSYKIQWLDSIQIYIRKSEYYGDVVTYNKNVDAYNNNLVNYNKMVDDYNAQRDAYNAEVQQFNSVLDSFRPSSAQVQTKQ